MKNLTVKTAIVYEKAKKILKNERGDGTDAFGILLKIVIAVIIGAVILALMKVAVPDLFNSIINKAKGVFEL